MKIIVVTGGSGYIGSTISYMLIEQGFKVINLDRSEPLPIFNQFKSNQYQWVSQDVSLSSTVDRAALYLPRLARDAEFYGLIHMAAWKDLPGSYDNPYEYYRNNLTSTIYATHLAHLLGCKKVIFSSSAGVYRDDLSGALSESSENTDGASPYGYTKLVGERIVHDICRQYEMTSYCLRYCNPIGTYKGISLDMSDSLFGNIVRHLDDGQFTIHGNDYDTPDGTCIRDYIDLRDVALAHIYFLTSDHPKQNSTINLGTGKGTSCLEVCKLVSELYPEFKYKIGPRRVGDAAGSYADIHRLRQYGFECKYGVKDAIKNILTELNK